MNFTFDSMIGTLGIYVLTISALAFAVERIMDLMKAFISKHFVAKLPTKGMDEEAFYKKEDSRQRRVRLWAIVFGLILAFICQIDTFQLLGIRSPYWFGFPVLGYTLSGLAASRGSAFWHDFIEMIRGIKEAKSELLNAKKRGQVETTG